MVDPPDRHEDARSLAELPTTYAVALRMCGSGASDEAIAAALAVPVEAVPHLIEIGRSKLRVLRERDERRR